MLIVAGEFMVDPDRREDFLAGRQETMEVSRGEDGCHEYVFSADPLVPGRVLLFERWESQAALDAHLAALRGRSGSGGPQVEVHSSSITIYEVAGERRLG